MVDDIAPTPDEFESALTELLGSLEQDRALNNAGAAKPNPKRSYVPEVGAGGYGMPYMPPMVENRLGGAELRSGTGAAPEVDAFMEATGLPLRYGPALDMAYSVGSAGPRQVQKAGQAIDRAITDPSLGSIANAGTQTGLAALRPAIALPSLAVQYGDAAARDLGLFDSSAQAQTKKGAAPVAPKTMLPGLTPDQQSIYDAAQKKITDRQYGSAAERRQLEQTMQELRALSNNIQLNSATSNQSVDADAKRKEREEYDRAVKRAEDVRAMEESKRRVFKDTEVGKVWEETGGTAPFLLGAASGFIQRGMNPDVSHKTVMGLGALGGAIASNLPLGADAYLVPPVENPDKRAAEGYARELPPTHPRKQEWLDYAASPRLPALNPARSEAEKALYDTEHYGLGAAKRNLFGAAEGLVGSEAGYGAWHVPARFFNALGRGAAATAQRILPQGSPPPTGGGAAPGIPSARNALEGPTGASAPVGPTPLGPSGGTPQRQLPAPEAAPNLSSAKTSSLPSWASEPPAGVKLPRDTFWDANRNQPRRKDGIYVEMPKYKHPKE